MLTLYDFLRAGHIKRWHIVNTANTQTIAEHSYLVAVISLHLFDKMVGVADDQSGALSMLCMALFHDAPEIRTGDVPTPSKRLFREVGGVDLFDRIEEELMPKGIPYMGGKRPTKELNRFVKMADAIEQAHWISENGVGRHAKIVENGCWRRLEDMVARNTAETGIDWYEPVNEVLMAMGMPYISREERITPP